jgi:hypothetical protein
MSYLSSLEQRVIERLSRQEVDEPAWVTRRKQAMIQRIKDGKINDITYDEWGEVYYPIDSDNPD